jgi:uncharacterized protein YjiK
VDRETITLRGIIVDPDGVEGVLVNGESAETSADLTTWTHTATLQAGMNELVISEETADGITEIDSIFVDRSASMTAPAAVVDDPSNNRLLVLDKTLNSVIAVDKESGTLSTASPPPGSANQITQPRGMVLDEARNRLLIFQGRSTREETHPEFLAVDLTTGAQSVFTAPDFADLFLSHSPRAMVLAGELAYVADVQFEYTDANGNEVDEDAENIADFRAGGIVYSINLTTGVRSVVSSRYVPEPEEEDSIEYPLLLIRSIAYNPTNSTIYALDTGLSIPGTNITIPRLIAINVADGKRSLLSLTDADKKTFSLGSPRMLDIDVAGQQLYLLTDITTSDVLDPTVAKIDIATKVAKKVSSNAIPENGDFILAQLSGFTYAADEGVIYLLEDSQDAVFQVNTTSGARSLVTATGPADAKNHTSNTAPTDIFFRNDHQTYLLDRKLSSVFGYNLYFGGKDILNNSVTNNVATNEEVLRTPTQGAWDPVNNVMLLTNSTSPGVLVTFDPATKEAVGKVSLNALAADIQVDAEAELAYVAIVKGIIEVDLNNDYSSKFISANGLPDFANSFSSIEGIALDPANNRLLAVDSGINAIVAVDTTTGSRTYFSPPSSTPDADDLLTLPRAIVIDQPNNRALVLDTGRKAILAADLTTGERTVVYEYAESMPRQLFTPVQMTMHPTANYLLLLDSTTNLLVALDLTGETPQLVNVIR